MKDAWDKKLFPPGNTTWDGAGDNQAYLAGQAAFIANTGSVGIAAKSAGSGALRGHRLFVAARRPEGRRLADRAATCAPIPKASKNPEAAKALIEHLAQPEFMNAYYERRSTVRCCRTRRSSTAFGGKDPILAGLLDLVQNGTAPAYPDVYNTAYADVCTNFIVPKMVQRVVIDSWDFDRAMDEAQTQTQAIYDKYK